MATDAEVIAFLVKVDGEEEAKKLAAAVALAQQKFEALYASLGKGDAATKAAANQLIGLKAKLDTASGSTKGMGQAMQQAGYAVDDLQYGFKGIANNIQPILSSIPALAGLAGPISIAAIAAFQLYEHWDQLMGLFGQSGTKSEAEEMDELGKATKRTADEEERYQKLKQQAKNAQAQGQPAQVKTDLSEAINKAIQNGPLDDINKGLDKHFGGRIKQMADADPRAAAADERLKAAQFDVNSSVKGTRRNDNALIELKAAEEAKNAIYGEARERFRTNLDRNPDDAKKVAEAARAHPRDFGQGGEAFATAMEAAVDPLAKQRKKVADAVENFFDKFKAAIPHTLDKKAKEMQAARDKADADFAHADDVAIANEDADRKRAKEARKDRKKNAVAKADKATAGTGLDGQVESAMVRSMLAGGTPEEIKKRVKDALARQFVAKGLNANEAVDAAEIKANEAFGKVGDDVANGARGPGKKREMPEPEKLRDVQRIGVADFARSVEGSGQSDQKKIADNTGTMKDQLTELVRQGKMPAQAG